MLIVFLSCLWFNKDSLETACTNMNNDQLSVLNEMVDPRLKEIAKKQIPENKSKEYYQGLQDAFLHASKMTQMNKTEMINFLTALVIVCEENINK